jgi:hypothetical protein
MTGDCCVNVPKQKQEQENKNRKRRTIHAVFCWRKAGRTRRTSLVFIHDASTFRDAAETVEEKQRHSQILNLSTFQNQEKDDC